jgi:hypothetical protein
MVISLGPVRDRVSCPLVSIPYTSKPEAAYFGTGASGERGGFIVFDLKETSQIPAIAEPFFLAYNAQVTFFPVMNAEDLAKAGPGIEKAVKEHSKAASA